MATYGQAAEDTLATQISDLVTYLNANPQLGVVPAVVPIEAYPGVSSAYHAWDANPCSVASANAVAAQITGVIHSIRAGAPGISYVTILGGDDIVPMGRVPDLTRVSNESEYASTFTVSNPISAAQAASATLTDDVYGDPNPTPIGDGNNLFVPQMAVGRLVESPTDIGSQLESYVTNKGTLDTKTGLVAGYDFLADGAQAVADRLTAGDGGRTVDTLIDQPGTTPGWSQADLLGKLFPTGGASPLVDSRSTPTTTTARSSRRRSTRARRASSRWTPTSWPAQPASWPATSCSRWAATPACPCPTPTCPARPRPTPPSSSTGPRPSRRQASRSMSPTRATGSATRRRSPTRSGSWPSTPRSWTAP